MHNKRQELDFIDLINNLVYVYNKYGLSLTYYCVLGRVIIFYLPIDYVCKLSDKCTNCEYIRDKGEVLRFE